MMKLRYAKWAQLPGGRKPLSQTQTATPTVIRDLPGFNAVEDAALLYGGDRLEEAAKRFTKRHFDIDLDDLDDFRPTDDTWIEPTELDRELQRHPRRLLVDYLNDDETVEFLLTLGFDLRCERGQPLRSTEAIAPQIEAAARGFAGRLPDRAAIEVETFEARMAADAAAFAARKRTRPR